MLAHLQVEQANLSQHLTVLRARQIVVSRKAGNQNDRVAMPGEMAADGDRRV